MYKKNIPRVSNLVSYFYPFEGNGKQRYLYWLKKNGIGEKEYLGGAQDMGTYIHECMENYIIHNKKADRRKKEYREVKQLIEHGYEWLDRTPFKGVESEVYLSDDKIQGTCDGVAYMEDKLVLFDFKTYGVVKRRFGLLNKFKVDTAKRKKVRLQMSVYAYLYKKEYKRKIDEIWLVFIHDEGVKQIKLDIIPGEEISGMIDEFINKDNYIIF